MKDWTIYKKNIAQNYTEYVAKHFDKSVDECSELEKFEAIVGCANYIASTIRRETLEARDADLKGKKIYYFSK